MGYDQIRLSSIALQTQKGVSAQQDGGLGGGIWTVVGYAF